MTQETAKIGLLDHMGGGNLGDDATFASTAQNIRTRLPKAQLFGFSANPADSQQRHGIPFFPIRRRPWKLGYAASDGDTSFETKARNLLRKYAGLYRVVSSIKFALVGLPKNLIGEILFLGASLRTLTSIDLLVIDGGGQLTEWYGPWEFLYTIFTWVVLAKLVGARCMFLNVGAGPLTRPLSKWFARHALSLADYVSFRDAYSRNLVRQIGFAGASQVFPDTVYALDVATPAVPRRTGRASKPVVGVAPMPYCDPRVFPEKNQAIYDDYIRKLAQFCSWLAKNGYRVEIFCSDIGIDPLAIRDLLAICARDTTTARDITSTVARTNEELFTSMSRMDYVVTSRFHGVVFAHMLNRPAIALSHHPKVATLMHDLGLNRYCIDIRHFDLQVLTRTFSALVGDRIEIKSRMAELLASYRRALTHQFDELFLRAKPRTDERRAPSESAGQRRAAGG